MEFGFLFWLFLIGISLAAFQDLKRREVDNWLNLLLLFSGGSWLVFSALFDWNGAIIIFGVVSFLSMFILANVFYYGRIFAGGDAKLLFAIFALFVGISFYDTMFNIGIFVLFLMISGSIYGLIYSGILSIKNFKEVRKEFSRYFKNYYLRAVVFFGIILFALSYVDWFFLIPAVILLIFPVLYVFAKALEKVVMIKAVSVRELREGDWLVDDLKVGRKVIRAGWEGLTGGDLKVLRNYKKKVKIKQGLPFVPAFLIAFLLYWFRDYFFTLIF